MTTAALASAILGRIVTPDAVIDDGAVVVTDEKFVFVGGREDAIAAGFAAEISAGRSIPDGATALPGLVDIHCHGGGGASFPDAPDAQTARIAALEHLRHGTTSLVGSLVTADHQTLLARVATLAQLADDGDLVGIHLEGPFLSALRCGAQDPNSMQEANPELVRAIADAARGHFATMTIAPELPGMNDVIDALADVGAIPSIGHTDAAYDITETALGRASERLGHGGARSGRPTATHLFNGMRPLHHRAPGPVAACLAAAKRGEAVVELIADGTHLADDTARFVFEMVGPDSIMLVTDAMAAAGMPDGDYDLGPMKVRVADGVARLAGGESIAGGTAHLLDVVRTCVHAGIDIVDVVRAATVTPAKVLGMSDRIGGLKAGLNADVVVVDAGMRPVEVMRRGSRVA